MIIFKTGDIFSEEVDAIVNPVNCVGVMGKGLALEFKKRYPYNFREYEIACKNKEIDIGKVLCVDTTSVLRPWWVINFPTKYHWKDKSSIAGIELGLKDLIRVMKDRDIQSIAIPALGAGLGGLEWTNVKDSITSILTDCLFLAKDVRIIVLEPL